MINKVIYLKMLKLCKKSVVIYLIILFLFVCVTLLLIMYKPPEDSRQD